MSPARRTASDPAASARARLAKLSRERGVELQLLLSQFAIERLLHRLGASRHGERYVLKGAMLFRRWSTERRRATWDLDLLGHGAHGVEDVIEMVRDLCAVSAEDGIAFDPDSIRAEEIGPEDDYAGVRVRLAAPWPERESPCRWTLGSETPSRLLPRGSAIRPCSTTHRRTSWCTPARPW